MPTNYLALPVCFRTGLPTVCLSDFCHLCLIWGGNGCR